MRSIGRLTEQGLRAGAGREVGCDMSHRGGPPGFVQVSPDGATLRWADYTGNDLFNTLGAPPLGPLPRACRASRGARPVQRALHLWRARLQACFARGAGNILANGRAGLLFIDFATGDTLSISGAPGPRPRCRALPLCTAPVCLRRRPAC